MNRKQVNKQLQEFAESAAGKWWREWNEKFADSPGSQQWQELGEQLRKLADSPAWQEMAEQVRKFEASPTARGLRELNERLRELDEAEEHEPPRERKLGGRPLSLTPDQIKVGKQLAIKRPDLATKELCELLRRELMTEASDATLRRQIINSVRT